MKGTSGSNTASVWRAANLGEVAQVFDCKHVTAKFVSRGYPVVSIGELGGLFVNLTYAPRTTERYFRLLTDGPRRLRPDDLIMSRNATVGRVSRVHGKETPFAMGQDVVLIRARRSHILPSFLQQLIDSPVIRRQFDEMMAGSTFKRVNVQDIKRLRVPVPGADEQDRIANALGRADELISTLERLIAKKQAIKQGMMQQLLTGRTRLPGFKSDWVEQDLQDAAEILDSQRMPLSAVQRSNRKGTFPYCGANGVVDRIDDYMIDDEVILLAEDGGNFDQWRKHPIAYRMEGKIWVNNHAHVLKAAANGDTRFLFYALEHKDITPFISSGTRSKLTRGELVRIKVAMPTDLAEQRKIAAVLNGVESEITVLNARLTKARSVKTGMMQQLLTGRVRLPVVEAVS